jgi:hypothetical protein
MSFLTGKRFSERINQGFTTFVSRYNKTFVDKDETK